MQTLHKLFAIPIVFGFFTFIGLTWLRVQQSSIPPGSLLSDLHKSAVVSYFHKQTPDYSHNNKQHDFSLDCVKDQSSSSVELTIENDTVASGGEVTVSWRGVSIHSADWIGLYCPKDASADKYLGYWLAEQSPTYFSGYGEVTFVVFNIRVAECEFRYYRNGSSCTTLLARSNPLKFNGGSNQPMHGHISLTGNPSEMRVQWTSATKTTPTVTYGYLPNQMNNAATGVTRTYSISDMCGRPATDPRFFIDPGYLHDVLLTDLKPSTTVFYRFGSVNGTSHVYNFTTAPDPTDPAGGFTFITYGDMGMSACPGAKDTVANVIKELRRGAQLAIHQGDLSYAVGYAYVWEQWMNLIEPIATHVPYMVGIGNHEQNYLTKDGNDGFHPSWGNYGTDSGGECGVPTLNRFHMPDNGNSLYWYSFDYGPVHFTFMSTEHNFTTGSLQYLWLQKDLEGVDRQQTPWLIVVGHRPMYTSEDYPADHKVALHLQSEGLEDLFHQYSVDMAFWGHYHSYERTCKVYKQKCTDTGVVNIVIGAAGAYLDSAKQLDVEWSKHLEMNFGYGKVTVANKTALLWEYVRNVDSVVSDSVWLTK